MDVHKNVEKILETLDGTLESDIEQVLDESHVKNSVTAKVESPTHDGVMYSVTFEKTGTPAKLSRYTEDERWIVHLFTEVSKDGKQSISNIKDVFYGVLDELFPEAEHVVNGDYMSGNVRSSYQTDKETFASGLIQ